MIKRLWAITAALLFSVTVHAQTVDMAFSPDGQAEELIIKTIDSSEESIRMAAYSFTSPQIVQKLVEAKKRGVDVKIVIDEKGNKSRASKNAMSTIANEEIPLRTVSRYKIHHDKYMVIDGKHVETGSFNYSQAAAKSNSENVIVIRDNEEVANQYLKHWESRWDNGKDWKEE